MSLASSSFPFAIESSLGLMVKRFLFCSLPHTLSDPFSVQEIKDAFFSMNKSSSPRPDGVGPAYFTAFWDMVSLAVIVVFRSFYDGSIDLTRINRAFLVLFPKTDLATHPSQFRHISLQNCIMKAITKVLTIRLKKLIHSLVDDDQTGFLFGRRISENIVYAADLVRCCHTRKASAIVFNIDFKKAFDSVNWESLIKILQARGFDDRCAADLSISSRLDILPSSLIGCPATGSAAATGFAKATRSPYLFIIVVDVLQLLIREAWVDGHLSHPLSPDLLCLVLQYMIRLKHSVSFALSLVDFKKAVRAIFSELDEINAKDLIFPGRLRTPKGSEGSRGPHTIGPRGPPRPRRPPPTLPRRLFAYLTPFDLKTQTDETPKDSGAAAIATPIRGRSLCSGTCQTGKCPEAISINATASIMLVAPWARLADKLPALFSHCTRPHTTVACVSTDGLALQPRLSGVATAELEQVCLILDRLALSDGLDRWCIDSPSSPPFSSREADDPQKSTPGEFPLSNNQDPTQIVTAVTRCSGGDGGDDDDDDDDDDDNGDGDDVQLDDDDDGVDFPLREGISPVDSCPPESSFSLVFSAPQRRL
ncbi:hypothetical protein QYE76_025144 [Lolium multiflorum]|uniref:Reverse transcriptase domain-containing protein n=1 Tax=Lolium multiflorum TaxID=4521 RepID=A0AAD8REM2_LOLMU|nr:hypothetical protein QYE76_025144 [Lolium multiflorum]